MIKFTTPEVEQDFNNLPDWTREYIINLYESITPRHRSDHALIFGIGEPFRSCVHNDLCYSLNLLDGSRFVHNYIIVLDSIGDIRVVHNQMSISTLQDAVRVIPDFEDAFPGW